MCYHAIELGDSSLSSMCHPAARLHCFLSDTAMTLRCICRWTLPAYAGIQMKLSVHRFARLVPT